MKKLLVLSLGLNLVFLTSSSIFSPTKQQKMATKESSETQKEGLKLGAFSVSLPVKDLKVSSTFYQNLGFKLLGGDLKQNYLILKNGNCIIGLFQGMFDKQMLTFNPGWDENAENIAEFNDIREIQAQVIQSNMPIIGKKIDPETSGPASLMLQDPDGNVILVDQHR